MLIIRLQIVGEGSSMHTPRGVLATITFDEKSRVPVTRGHTLVRLVVPNHGKTSLVPESPKARGTAYSAPPTASLWKETTHPKGIIWHRLFRVW